MGASLSGVDAKPVVAGSILTPPMSLSASGNPSAVWPIRRSMTRGCRRRRPTEPERASVQHLHAVHSLGDADESVGRDVLEMLDHATRRPRDLQPIETGGTRHADLRAERA